MIIDGRALAQNIFDELKQRIEASGKTPVLSVILVGSNPASESYVRLKTKKAEEIGVKVELFKFDESATEEEILSTIEEEAKLKHPMIVQMPLPEHFDTQKILDAVPAELDCDLLSTAGKKLFEDNVAPIYPPVVGSMREILRMHDIPIKGKKVTIIGQGDLVGKPAAIWMNNKGAEVTVATRATENLSDLTKNADIILSGAGVPGLIKPDMVKEGVIILDAGTSEDSGEIVGDALQSCADKSSLFTPVPGGIGPMTVAILLKNVVTETGI